MNKDDVVKLIDGIPYYRYEYTDFLYQKLEDLKEENQRLKEVINDDMTTYLKGLEDGKDKMKECYNSVYKSRCEKAIEYIKNNCYYLVDNDDKNLLNILGGDEE